MEEKILSVGTNMHKARLFLKSKGYDVSHRQKILDDIRRDIPNVRNCNCKFILGVTRMYVEGDFSNVENVAGVNAALKFVTDKAHYQEYDSNLNAMSATTITERFKTIDSELLDIDKIESKKRTNKMRLNPDYTIVAIDDYAAASKYMNYTSWCVTQSESAYDSYTSSKRGRFYFCLKKGFETVSKIQGINKPLDEYGLSMIAVSITMEGECNTITCRWNHDNGGNDSVMTVEELEKLLGGSFYEMFPPYTKQELKDKGLYISENIGKYYLDMRRGVEGVVVAVDKNENPTQIMHISDQQVMTWDEAMAYNKTLKNGWHIPSKDELENIWFIKSYDNIITKKINNGLKRYDSIIYQQLNVEGDYVIWNTPEGNKKYFSIASPILI